jgi:Tol biopolymer transport system component
MIGKTVSHYEILEKIGEGGKGAVYKAADQKLDRFAALKFMPSHFAVRASEGARFVREAKAASALEHPNICTIYEIDRTADGQLFIAMAYYEGETLQETISRGPLELSKIIDFALQISSGLDKAHSQGIVHRDIKPANIMITTDGVVKLLDFGLAKLHGQTQLTGSGATMGTLLYMSPEQVVGDNLDHRTDIWSLGVVLYEMLTGRVPFKGDYDQVVVYSIRHEVPEPITALRTGVPCELEWITNKCTEKEAKYRYQSARDMQTDLNRLARDMSSHQKDPSRAAKPAKSRASPFARLRVWVELALALAFVGLAAYLAYDKLRAGTVLEHPAVRLTALTGVDGLAAHPTWSPDGSWIAYSADEAGTMDIWKKPAEGGQSQRLTSSRDNEIQPAWSPDGRIIAFSSRGEQNGIHLIPADGGTPWRLTEFGANPRWSPNGERLAFDWQGDIYTISANGGDPEVVVKGTSSTPYAVWTPDGQHLVYWSRTRGDICMTSVKDTTSICLAMIPAGQEVSGLSLSVDGRKLIFCQGTFGGNKDVWIADFVWPPDERANPPAPVLATTTQDVQCTFSPDGRRIAFTARHVERQLYALSIDATTGLSTGALRRLTMNSQLNYYPSISYDEQRLIWTSHQACEGALYYSNLKQWTEHKVTRDWARDVREVGGSFSAFDDRVCFASTVGGAYEIWHIPSLGGVGLQCTETLHPHRDVFPTYSPVGDRIAFYSNRSGSWDIWSVNGRGELQQLTSWSSNEYYPAWSADGQSIAFATDRSGNMDIWIMDAHGENLRPLVTEPSEEGWSAWSPDGRWFYYVSDKSGAFNLWVMADGDTDTRQVTPFRGEDLGLPEAMLFTKFAVSSSHVILPLERRSGNIYILETAALGS